MSQKFFCISFFLLDLPKVSPFCICPLPTPPVLPISFTHLCPTKNMKKKKHPTNTKNTENTKDTDNTKNTKCKKKHKKYKNGHFVLLHLSANATCFIFHPPALHVHTCPTLKLLYNIAGGDNWANSVKNDIGQH